MKLAGLTAPTDLPSAGARVPALAVRAIFLIAGLLLSMVDYGFTGWLAVGIVLSVAAAWSPRHLLAWGLVLYLAAGRLAHHASLSWQFLVILAGVHLLHVLGMLALELPSRSWVQPQLFLAPLRRFLVIQVPTQLLAILALLLLAPSPDGHRPLTIAGFGVVGALALAGLALLLSGPRRDDAPPPPPALDGVQARSRRSE
jgi:hypothetical protein